MSVRIAEVKARHSTAADAKRARSRLRAQSVIRLIFDEFDPLGSPSSDAAPYRLRTTLNAEDYNPGMGPSRLGSRDATIAWLPRTKDLLGRC
jgi:hypothetical protein